MTSNSQIHQIEVVLDAARAPPPARVKGLSERIG